MMAYLESSVIWELALAFATAVLYLFYGEKVIQGKRTASYVIVLFCLWAVLVLSPKTIAPNMLRITGLFVLSVAAGVVCAGLGVQIFNAVKKVIAARLRFDSSLPEPFMEICRAMELLAVRHIGALIVVEKKQPLESLITGSIPFDAQIKAEILIALFATTSPVHDGAIIVSGGRIKRVKSVLPLATTSAIPLGVGTRHRSAVGITEYADAIALVVSEERGEMSIAYQGALIKAPSLKDLVKMLRAALKGKKINPPQKSSS
ncbi:MAG: DNA integrity scanning protein DisA nucleotide-binding domain protein [Candidatus Omnitrophica bacterium]|nr:DNA integrity scanning protein DisA nucleotide-binding domain protein [Candidatus Omnitrophota bacterium]